MVQPPPDPRPRRIAAHRPDRAVQRHGHSFSPNGRPPGPGWPAGPRREARTTQLFASLGLEPLECTVLTDLAGRVTAAVTLPRTSFTPGECRALAEEMGRICRRDFDPPEVTNCRTVTMLHFGERRSTVPCSAWPAALLRRKP